MNRFSALAFRDFRLLFSGQTLSLVGTQMQHVALAWQVYDLTKSPLSLGTIGLCRIVPVILFALGGGVVADAVERRRLMIVTQSTLALTSLLLAILTWSGHVSAPFIYLAVFCAGIAIAFDTPARQSLLPQLVPIEHLPNALSLGAMGWTVASILGPALGGLLIATSGVLPIYIIDFLSFFGVIGALLAMRPRGRSPSAAVISLRAAWEGLAFLRRSPLILSTMLLDFFVTFFGGSILLLPIFAVELLHIGPDGLGLLFAAQPAGAALAAFILSTRAPIRRQGVFMLTAVAIYGAAIAVFGLSPWLPLSVAALAVSGAADTVSMVIRQTLRQTLTPDELRGRMTSVNMIFFMGGPQLGEFEAGVVASALGARVSVASGGVLSVCAVVCTALLVPGLRHLQRAEPAQT